MTPENEVKLSQSLKVVMEMKKTSGGDSVEGFENKGFYISGLTKERIILGQDVWASQVDAIEKITCFLKIDDHWSKHEMAGFYAGKKSAENSAKKKDRIIKSFAFSFNNASGKSAFEKVFSKLNP